MQSPLYLPGKFLLHFLLLIVGHQVLHGPAKAGALLGALVPVHVWSQVEPWLVPTKGVHPAHLVPVELVREEGDGCERGYLTGLRLQRVSGSWSSQSRTPSLILSLPELEASRVLEEERGRGRAASEENSELQEDRVSLSVLRSRSMEQERWGVPAGAGGVDACLNSRQTPRTGLG